MSPTASLVKEDPSRMDAGTSPRRAFGLRTADERDVGAAYDGSNVLFRLMRMTTWGPGLMNLGHYRFRGPLAFLNLFANLSWAQHRLALKSLRLLDVRPGDRVLDVACGRGKSSFMARCARDAVVVGLDVLEENIAVAEALFGRVAGLSYEVGDATDLAFADGSFDRVQCVEAAFHFPDRAEFLREAYRVLRPGGRLVVVDVVWRTREAARPDDPEVRTVRETWKWEDLFTAEEYRRSAAEAGFRTVATGDWTRAVSLPFHRLFCVLLGLQQNRLGRRLLLRRNPMFAELSEADWSSLRRIARAHEFTQRLTRYMAFTFDKP